MRGATALGWGETGPSLRRGCRTGAAPGRAWGACQAAAGWSSAGAGFGPGWVTVHWGRIVVGGRRSGGPVLGLRDLEHLLGGRTMARLYKHSLFLGAEGLPHGRLLDLGPRGIVLQVGVGGLPVAELADWDRDRRIDRVRVNVGRLPAPGYGNPYPVAGPAPSQGYLLGPELALRHAQVESGGIHYAFSVPNWEAFAPDLFRPAPDLPACGLNRMSSRTWVDVLDGSGRRLYGFCALESPQGLDGIWTFVPDGDPASEVYLVLTDRLTGESVTSNLVALR